VRGESVPGEVTTVTIPEEEEREGRGERESEPVESMRVVRGGVAWVVVVRRVRRRRLSFGILFVFVGSSGLGGGWVDGWMDGWVDGLMDCLGPDRHCLSPCVCV